MDPETDPEREIVSLLDADTTLAPELREAILKRWRETRKTLAERLRRTPDVAEKLPVAS